MVRKEKTVKFNDVNSVKLKTVFFYSINQPNVVNCYVISTHIQHIHIRTQIGANTRTRRVSVCVKNEYNFLWSIINL